MKRKIIQWKTIVERHQTPIYMDTLLKGQRGPYLQEALGFPFEFSNIKRVVLPLRVDNQEIEALKEKMKSSMRENAFFISFGKRCKRECDAFVSRSLNTSLLLKNEQVSGDSFIPKSYLESNDLSRHDQKIFSSYINNTSLIGAFLITFSTTDFLLQELFDTLLTNQCQKLGIDEEISNLREALLIPKHLSHESQARVEVLDIGAEIQHRLHQGNEQHDKIVTILERLSKGEIVDISNLQKHFSQEWPDLEKRIYSFVKKYGWMDCLFYRGSLMTWESAIKRIAATLDSNCKDELSRMRSQREEAEEGVKNAIYKLSFSESELELIEVVRDFFFLKTYRLDSFFIAQSYMRPLFEKIAKTFDIEYDDLLFMTSKEISNAFNEDISNIDQIRSRKDRYAVVMNEGTVSWYSGNECAPFLKEEGLEFRSEKELTGVTACRGKATGTVKIVTDIGDIEKVQKGDVLVTTMTLPIMTTAVEKAAAIVTNEGGMLCHAAIISREFNIPCVIATENATRTFRDGDIVEVDGTNAIVKIVETNS